MSVCDQILSCVHLTKSGTAGVESASAGASGCSGSPSPPSHLDSILPNPYILLYGK